MNGRALQSALKATGWDDYRLADETKISITLIRRYLRGQVSIGAKNALKIARALDLPVEQVLYGTNQSHR